MQMHMVIDSDFLIYFFIFLYSILYVLICQNILFYMLTQKSEQQSEPKPKLRHIFQKLQINPPLSFFRRTSLPTQ